MSVVIVMFRDGSPIAGLVPNEPLRSMLTAFLFGTVGSAIAVSWVGRDSGAYINPAVTMAFWMMRKLDLRAATGYIVAQLLGAWLGALPLLALGSMGRSVLFGATIPGNGYSTGAVLLGEIVTTFGLIATLCVFLGFRRLRRYTPFVIPFLSAVMVPLEAHISGTSTNPARTFGPALISGLGTDGGSTARPDHRHAHRHRRLQFSRPANRSGEAVPLRERSPPPVSPDGRRLRLDGVGRDTIRAWPGGGLRSA